MPKMRYGWKPDVPDFRDQMYEASFIPKPLPAKADLRQYDIPIFDQGDLGSCTGNAIGAHVGMLNKKAGKDFIPSRLFIYYNEREMEGTVNEDAGAFIRDGIKSIAKLGACSEASWPYNQDKFTTKPLMECYTEALNHQGLAYKRLGVNLKQMKQCLADGFPFVFGFAVYESFESDEVARTGKMPMPTKDEKSFGGHAVMAVGYDDNTKCFTIRNSWGTGWGDKGYFYMPYDYISNGNLCDDFWTIRKIEI